MNKKRVKTEYYYLAYKTQADGSVELDPISRDEWRAILRQNRGKKGNDRRYFTREFNAGYDRNYWLVCEVSWEEYREWDALRQADKRNRKFLARNFQTVSLDAPAYQDDEDSLLYRDIIADPNADTERDGEWLAKWNSLRAGLAAWKEWGPEMLDYYHAGMGRSCTMILAKEHGRSPEDIRYRKRTFREVVRTLCKQNGIGNFD